MTRLVKANRLVKAGTILKYRRFLNDFSGVPIANYWDDTSSGASRSDPKIYVVQTTSRVIERCILMTTDPGDLIFDPTCGSGTSAYVAEQWGRRWITCDTSRVALALARQRLMTATFSYYKLAHAEQGVRGAFVYKTIPHVMLKSIANNAEIDTIYERYQAQLEPQRNKLNQLLNQSWEEWQIPCEAVTTWSIQGQQLHAEWWQLRQERQQKIDASIAHNAETETLYDQPEIDRSLIRVAGPFTVEAVQPPSLDPDAIDVAAPAAADDAGTYLDRMIEQLRRGVLTIRGQHLPIKRISPLVGGVLHAECDYEQAGKTIIAAVIFGPQYGPLTSSQLQDALGEARGSYSALIAAAFTFDDQAHALLQKATLRPPVIGVAINADLLMGNLLKTSKSSQVFSVFGKPDVTLSPPSAEGYTVSVKGIDIYDPNTGDFDAASAEQIAAWFLDSDYDGATFLVRHAYFPS